MQSRPRAGGDQRALEVKAASLPQVPHLRGRLEPYSEARALHVDLVVTWGTTVTLGMVSTYDKVNPSINLTDIPVLFMIVTDPVDERRWAFRCSP